MHGLRRRLSEPRMAGHLPADRSANQRVTSAGDSFLCILMCGTKHTCIQSKKQGENRACGKLEKRRIYRAILGFATETRLSHAAKIWPAAARVPSRRRAAGHVDRLPAFAVEPSHPALFLLHQLLDKRSGVCE